MTGMEDVGKRGEHAVGHVMEERLLMTKCLDGEWMH